MKISKKLILFSFVFISAVSVVFANVIEGYGVDYNRKDVYTLAKNKFALTNVKSAHDEFSALISDSSSKDFVLLDIAIILAEYGLFDLTDSIFSKIDDSISMLQMQHVDRKKYVE